MSRVLTLIQLTPQHPPVDAKCSVVYGQEKYRGRSREIETLVP
jgi:hypothetical protein